MLRRAAAQRLCIEYSLVARDRRRFKFPNSQTDTKAEKDYTNYNKKKKKKGGENGKK